MKDTILFGNCQDTLKEFADDPIYEIEMLKKNLIRRYR